MSQRTVPRLMEEGYLAEHNDEGGVRYSVRFSQEDLDAIKEREAYWRDKANRYLEEGGDEELLTQWLMHEIDKESPKEVYADEAMPIVTFDDYYKSTTARFKNLLADDAVAAWNTMKEQSGYEWHKSTLSKSEYLVDKSSGDIYRFSNHWGNVASCRWGLDKKENSIRFQIGVCNLKDFRRWHNVINNPNFTKEDWYNRIGNERVFNNIIHNKVIEGVRYSVVPKEHLEGKKVSIIPTTSEHGFRNIKEARDWGKTNLVGEYNNPELGKVYISGRSVEKYLSGKAVEKSSSADTHLATLRVIGDVIENSIIGEIHEDVKGNEHINDIVRLYGCVDVDGKLNRVKTTVKRFKREGQQAYSYEVTEIEKLEGTSEADISQLPRTTNFSIDAAKLVNNFGSRKENGKKNSGNTQGSDNVRYSVSPEHTEETNILAEAIQEEETEKERSEEVRFSVADDALEARRAFENVMANMPKYREAGYEDETMTEYFKRFAEWRKEKERLESEEANREYERLFNAKMPYLPEYDKSRMTTSEYMLAFRESWDAMARFQLVNDFNGAL